MKHWSLLSSWTRIKINCWGSHWSQPYDGRRQGQGRPDAVHLLITTKAKDLLQKKSFSSYWTRQRTTPLYCTKKREGEQPISNMAFSSSNTSRRNTASEQTTGREGGRDVYPVWSNSQSATSHRMFQQVTKRKTRHALALYATSRETEMARMGQNLVSTVRLAFTPM